MKEEDSEFSEMLGELSKIRNDISVIKGIVVGWGILTALGICAFLFNLMKRNEVRNE